MLRLGISKWMVVAVVKGLGEFQSELPAVTGPVGAELFDWTYQKP